MSSADRKTLPSPSRHFRLMALPSVSSRSSSDVSGEDIEHGRLFEEQDDLVGEGGEHLLFEVVEDVVLSPGDGVRAARPVVTHGQRQELETRRPSLGAGHDGRQLVVGAGRLHRANEACRFVIGHDQITGRDRPDQVVEPATGERHIREGSADEHDLAARRHQRRAARRAGSAIRSTGGGGRRRGPRRRELAPTSRRARHGRRSSPIDRPMPRRGSVSPSSTGAMASSAAAMWWARWEALSSS